MHVCAQNVPSRVKWAATGSVQQLDQCAVVALIQLQQLRKRDVAPANNLPQRQQLTPGCAPRRDAFVLLLLAGVRSLRSSVCKVRPMA